MINVIAAVGLNLLTGNSGQISLCHSSFMAIGAYGSTLLTAKFGVPFWGAIPLGALLAALMGALLGAPASRLRGIYLALATLGVPADRADRHRGVRRRDRRRTGPDRAQGSDRRRARERVRALPDRARLLHAGDLDGAQLLASRVGPRAQCGAAEPACRTSARRVRSPRKAGGVRIVRRPMPASRAHCRPSSSASSIPSSSAYQRRCARSPSSSSAAWVP